MELLKFLRYQKVFVVVCILFTIWIGGTTALQLCQYGVEKTHLTNLNMDSSTVSSSGGMCSCMLQLNNDAKLTMFPKMSVPECSTRVTLSDLSYEFKCQNGKIPPNSEATSYVREKKAGEALWLFVESKGVVNATTGQLQIKTTQNDSTFTLGCFNANENSSSTTQILTTQAMTIIPTITKSIQDVITSMTPVNKETLTMQTASETNSSVTKTSSDDQPLSSESTPTITYDKRDGIKEKEFPVAAVAGGIAGGLVLISVVILAVVCFRRRNQEPNFLRNRTQLSTDDGNDNRAYDSDVPTIGEIKPQDTQSSDNTNLFHMENELYASADSDHQQHHSQVNLTDSMPGHYASPSDLSIDKSEVETVEGSEIVITSSGDLYSVVDESKKNQDQLVTDTNPTASLADLYAVVDPTMTHQDELLFDLNPTQDDEYVVVNKKQDPQDIDPTSVVSPSGDVYAVVNKKQDPQDIDPTSMVSPSGDVYAVVNKKQDPQDFDTTHTFSPFGDVDKKCNSQVIDPNHVTSSSGDVYAVVEKKQDVVQNDHMARSATHDEEEEAIRRVMDMNDERPSSDTLQSTSL